MNGDFHQVFLKELFKKARSTKIEIVDVISDLPWHATRKWKKRSIDKTDTIVLHTADTYASLENINTYDIRPGNHISKKGCPHFTYHFYIDYPNGKIYQANKLTDITWHARGANTRGIGITLQGKFFCFGGSFKQYYTHSHLGKKKTITDPTDNQLISIIQLLDYLREETPNKRLLGHCNVSPISRKCDPGDTAYYLLKVYRSLI